VTTRVRAVEVVMGDEEKAAVSRVLDSGRLVQGEEVAAFEHEFSALVDGRPCVAVNSGTSALHLALLALGVGAGDEVIVPSFTFAATANAVVRAGAVPRFVDILPDSFCLDPDAVERAITPRTVAMVPVHLFGQVADMAALTSLADAHGLRIIEDAAQAHAAEQAGRPAGAWGAAAAFSFYATKNMTTGEGGMVACEDETVARSVRLLRNQGMERRYHNEVAGLNNRMTDLAASIGRVQLRSLAAWNARRQAIAERYAVGLHRVVLPRTMPGNTHVFHQFTIRVDDRDHLQKELLDAGVESGVFYPVPTHRLPAYDLALDLPETDRAAREVLSLPVHPRLSDEDVDLVVTTLNDLTAGTS